MPELKETVEITTPVLGKTVVLRGYITGRQNQAIIAGAKADGEGFSADVAIAATNKALEVTVISVDGATENVLDLILDMPSADYEFVVAEVNKVTSPLAN